jgi:uroporphyrinogen decarboxylase
MTPRERVLTALRRQTPDRVPKSFGWTPPVADLLRTRLGDVDPYDHFGVETRPVGPVPTREPGEFSRYFAGLALPPTLQVDEWGMGEIPDPDVHYTTYVFPLVRATSAAEIAEYPWPDRLSDYRWSGVAAEVQALHDRGLAAEGGMECSVFERAWYLRSMEALFADFVENPKLAEALLDKITDISCGTAERYARADVDVLGLGDDVSQQRGMLMSPTTWRKWLKPRLARIIGSARAVKPDIIVRYHSDGNPEAIIPELIEIGVDVLNPVQPECLDPADVKRRFGGQLAFWGTIGTQTTMPFGTPEEVARVVRERIETVGAGGGLVLAPTHVLQPDVPWENILAFFDSIERYGRY